jgi:hypothetical protein
VRHATQFYRFLGGIVTAVVKTFFVFTRIRKTKPQDIDLSTYEDPWGGQQDHYEELILDDLLYMEIVYECGFSLPNDNARGAPEGV